MIGAIEDDFNDELVADEDADELDEDYEGTMLAEEGDYEFVGNEDEVPDVSGAYSPFDARTKWGSCIRPVINQGSCGSCWAVATAAVLTDRICIKSGSTSVDVSPQHLLNCETRSRGCWGGYPSYAFKYLVNYGAPHSKCVPYTGRKQTCSSRCSSSSYTSTTKYKCKSGSQFTTTSTSTMMNQIKTYGPLETTFTVYSDFYNYRSGIYKYVSGRNYGGHAVKVVGWGTTNGINYWIAQNSWGTRWGENGFFRIQMGQVGFGRTMYGCSA